MAGSRGRYPPEYKEQIVELVRSGRSAGSLAREFEPSEQTIRNWVKQADLDEGRRSDGLQDVGIQGVTRRRFKTARLPSVVQPGPSMAHRPAYRKCFRRGPTMTKLLNHRQPHSEVDLPGSLARRPRPRPQPDSRVRPRHSFVNASPTVR